jgi:hypothetical protein
MANTSLSAKLALFEANISNNNGHISQDKTSFLANSALFSNKTKFATRKVSAPPKPPAVTKRGGAAPAWKNITEESAKSALSFVDLTGFLLDEDEDEHVVEKKKPAKDCTLQGSHNTLETCSVCSDS